jgi:hypothetical protein
VTLQPIDLEGLADRKLRELRPPHAPHTLLPRVLAAVQQWTLRPWYSRAWLTWPAAWQVTSIAGLILLIAAGAALLPEARSAVTGAASKLAPGAIGDLTDIARGTAVAMTAAQALWRTLFEPFVKYLFALVVMMGLACAAFGSALGLVAFGRTSHP